MRIEQKLTPQLEHPQLPQLPLQLEQLAQEQGDIFGSWFLFFGLVGWVCGLYCLFDLWWMKSDRELMMMKKKKEEGRERKGKERAGSSRSLYR